MKKLLLLVPLALLACSCGSNRMTVAEMTVIGLSATPGNTSSEMPQVTIAYKRAEVALVPTKPQAATGSTNSSATDCYSAFSSLHFSSQFLGPTKIADVLGTGMAARSLVTNDQFGLGFSNVMATNK